MQLLINCPAEGHSMEELWSTLGPGTKERKNLWSSHLFGLTLLFQHVQTMPSPPSELGELGQMSAVRLVH